MSMQTDKPLLGRDRSPAIDLIRMAIIRAEVSGKSAAVLLIALLLTAVQLQALDPETAIDQYQLDTWQAARIELERSALPQAIAAIRLLIPSGGRRRDPRRVGPAERPRELPLGPAGRSGVRTDQGCRSGGGPEGHLRSRRRGRGVHGGRRGGSWSRRTVRRRRRS